VGPVDADGLQRSLRHAARLFDPVRTGLLESAASAYATRIPGAELAEVAFDSRTAPLPVRGDARVRLLTFESAAVTVDVEVTSHGPGALLVGRLSPGGPAEVVARGGGRPVRTAADGLGRFGFRGLPYGPVSLLVRFVEGGPYGLLVTDWIGL
jgi:hypothetical protein